MLDIRLRASDDREGRNAKRPGPTSRSLEPCEVPACVRSATNGKRFCIDHLALRPYVRAILTEIGEREREGRASGRLRPNSSVLADVRTYLRHAGEASIEGIVRMTGIPEDGIRAALRLLGVKRRTSPRGAVFVRLRGPDEAEAS